jgi:hypothetical protein
VLAVSQFVNRRPTQQIPKDRPDTSLMEAALQHDSANLDLLRSLAVLFVFSFHVYLYQVQNHQLPELSPFRLEIHQLGALGRFDFLCAHKSSPDVFSGTAAGRISR